MIPKSRLATRQVLQIIPAGGWSAVFYDHKAPYYYIESLVAWALINDEEEGQLIEGVSSADLVELSSESGDLMCYSHADQITEEAKKRWTEEGKRHLEAMEGKTAEGRKS